jgi:hypothetical protein
VWAVFHIISVVQPSKETAKAKSAAFYIGKNPASRKNSYQTVGINILKVQTSIYTPHWPYLQQIPYIHDVNRKNFVEMNST